MKGSFSLLDLAQREPFPEPWSEGEKIPWQEPGFSARMLREHLTQAHDGASRRFGVIDEQVTWIHEHLLAGQPTRILDLGCGPGLYGSRLARLGHDYLGIDFSPAAIAHAWQEAGQEGLNCRYVQADLRVAEYGSGHGLVMLLYGEFNTFPPQTAEAILSRSHDALAEGGLLLLEPHTFEAVRTMGIESTPWYSSPGGLFSERPHICLQENFWDAGRSIATERYFIIDAQTAQITRHASSSQAYTDEQYWDLLLGCGFGQVEFHRSLRGGAPSVPEGLLAIVARKTTESSEVPHCS